MTLNLLICLVVLFIIVLGLIIGIVATKKSKPQNGTPAKDETFFYNAGQTAGRSSQGTGPM